MIEGNGKIDTQKNYQKYDKLTKVMNYIEKKYEDLSERPLSVKNEY